MQAHTVNEVRIFFFISLLLVIVFRLIIPGISEVKRQNKISEKNVSDYNLNSETVTIPQYRILGEKNKSVEYTDGVPLVKKVGRKD